MKQERILKEYKILDNKANTLQVSLYYSKGGMNYFTGVNEPRGIWLSVTPYEITEYEWGGRSKGVVAFSGVKTLIKETKRFNQKELDSIVVDEIKQKDLIKHTILKNNLTIADEI